MTTDQADADSTMRAADAAVRSLSKQLPLDLQHRFSDAVKFSSDTEPAPWARRVRDLSALIRSPSLVIAALDEQALRAM